jgi:hypothetical protein
MTQEDFKTRLADINAKYEQEKKYLYSQYAHENNTVNVDDIVEDHIGCGRVLKMKTTFATFDKYPSLVYECIEVKKDGTPKKKNIFRQVYQVNLKKVNGKPVNYEKHYQ